MAGWALKYSDEVLDYQIDWTRNLSDDSIAGSAVTIDPSGSLAVERQSNQAGVVTVWLSGGSPGGRYTLTNEITTAGGRVLVVKVPLTVAI